MAEEYAEHRVRFVFVYTREAHPGDDYPHHTSMEQKLRHARDMVAYWKFKRSMLVDDLEGTLHHAYGRLPNMTHIVNAGGNIIYRANWTDPRSIRIALDQIRFERDQRRAKKRMTPYYMEWQPSRHNESLAFMEGLVMVGPKAIEEYIAATAHSEGEAAADILRNWWKKKQAEAGN